jgi:ABC-type bacteriocin/lantibiotic exporter with double-glycine peptidase domain
MKLRRAMADIDLPTYENPKFNDLLSSVREQSTWKARTFTQRNFLFIQDCLQLLIAASILLYASWWLALVVIVCTMVHPTKAYSVSWRA